MAWKITKQMRKLDRMDSRNEKFITAWNIRDACVKLFSHWHYDYDTGAIRGYDCGAI